VQTEQSRDDKTIVIATALGIFVLIMVAGSALLWAATSALNVRNSGSGPLFTLVIAASAIASVVYLARTSKR